MEDDDAKHSVEFILFVGDKHSVDGILFVVIKHSLEGILSVADRHSVDGILLGVKGFSFDVEGDTTC